MFSEEIKYKNFLWWMGSLAVSVLCCAALFVLFAGYVVEIKSDIEDQNLRLSIAESRQKRVMADIEALRERANAMAPAIVPAAVAPDATATPAAAAPPGSAAPDMATPPALAAPAPAPAVTAPPMLVTPDAAGPDKK